MHIDMDAFFASVEQLDNPSLKGLPVIVGGNSMRGVVSAASYEARAFGVHSAMPIFRAKALCPNGVYVRGNKERYSEVSRAIMDVLRDFSPLVEPASIDEAFLDASGLERLFGPVDAMACALKNAVTERTGLTCSVGLAPVKFLAKIMSDKDKPDGLSILYPEDIPEFLRTLPVERIPGVGKKTLPSLRSLGVRFAADVLRYPEDFWSRRFGKAGRVLYARGQGIDTREVVPYEPPKSESAENTFEKDTLDKEILHTWLLRQSERVGRNLRKMGCKGRTITLKVKYADFSGVTRARTLTAPTNLTRVIFDTAVALLDELNPKDKLRLIGVGVSGFGEEGGDTGIAPAKAVQLSLLGGGEPRPEPAGTGQKAPDIVKETALEAAMDAVLNKFGKSALMRGRLFAQDAAHREEEDTAAHRENARKADSGKL